MAAQLFGPVIIRIKRRRSPMQIHAALGYNPFYDADSQTFLAVRPVDIDAGPAPYGQSGEAGALFVGFPESPFLGVITVANQETNEGASIYVTDLLLNVMRTTSADHALLVS